jgi:hypothetical protein
VRWIAGKIAGGSAVSSGGDPFEDIAAVRGQRRIAERKAERKDEAFGDGMVDGTRLRSLRRREGRRRIGRQKV